MELLEYANQEGGKCTVFLVDVQKKLMIYYTRLGKVLGSEITQLYFKLGIGDKAVTWQSNSIEEPISFVYLLTLINTREDLQYCNPKQQWILHHLLVPMGSLHGYYLSDRAALCFLKPAQK